MKHKKTLTIEIPEREPSPIPRTLLTLEEAAEALNLSRSFVCVLVKDKRLVSLKIGKRRLVPVSEIEAFVSRSVSGIL